MYNIETAALMRVHFLYFGTDIARMSNNMNDVGHEVLLGCWRLARSESVDSRRLFVSSLMPYSVIEYPGMHLSGHRD